MWPRGSRIVAILSVLLFLISLAVTIYGRTQGLGRNWYQARAVAEAIKTTSWLYMMAAQPYNGNDVAAGQLFRATILQLLQDNRSLGDHFAGTPAADEQLTPRMEEVRGFGIGEKVNFYRPYRI